MKKKRVLKKKLKIQRVFSEKEKLVHGKKN
jgi:hypothetical protein